MRRRTQLALAPLLVLFFGDSTAHAEEKKFDYADGIGACKDLEKRNDKELAEWEKAQPAVKYVYDRPDNVLGAPWGKFLSESGSIADLILATAVPQFGAQYRLDAPAIFVSWPMQIPFGPTFTCSRRQGTFVVAAHKPNRFLIEPGLVGSKAGAGFHVRPGYRFLYQPSDWVVGAGAGVGSTIELTGNQEPKRASAGGEIVLRFGKCCEADFFTLVFRYDHYFAGNTRDIVGGALGFTYF